MMRGRCCRVPARRGALSRHALAAACFRGTRRRRWSSSAASCIPCRTCSSTPIAAIANAVWHATGVRYRTLPLTPDRERTPLGGIRESRFQYGHVVGLGRSGEDRCMTRHQLDPSPSTTVDVFSRDLTPVLTVDSGDTVVLRSLNASGYLQPQTFPGEKVPMMAGEGRRGHCLKPGRSLSGVRCRAKWLRCVSFPCGPTPG